MKSRYDHTRQILPCFGYNECEGKIIRVGDFIALHDCRCGWRKYWLVRAIWWQWGGRFLFTNSVDT